MNEGIKNVERHPDDTIYFVVPALNEEGNVRDTIDNLLDANKDYQYKLNVLIVNDGSSDGTRVVAESIAAEYPFVEVINNKYTRGMGTAFVIGLMKNISVKATHNSYYGLLPGDNELAKDTLLSIFKNIGKADAILNYPVNPEVRTWSRRVISILYQKIYNILFGVNIRYFNGPVFFRIGLLRELDLPTRFFSFHAETVIRFIKHGYSYIEVPGRLQPRKAGKSTALRWWNFVGILLGTFFIFSDVHIIRRMHQTKKQDKGR
jgi:glycosyltransferase involved in cell wall biosynthesis